MTKNVPARERPALRTHGKYAKHDKASHAYPSWVTEKRSPPEAIARELAAARAGAFLPRFERLIPRGRLAAKDHPSFSGYTRPQQPKNDPDLHELAPVWKGR